MMMPIKSAYHRGYTLIELMMVVGVLGILASLAVPAYQGYISGSKLRTAQTNANILAGFQDTYYYENDTYLAGVYDPSTSTDDLTAALDWTPTGDNNLFRYVVAAGSTGNIADSYTITVTLIDDTSITATVSKP